MRPLAYIVASLVLLGLPNTARAENLLFDYYSLLGPADAYSSSGLPLNDFCAIVQQDRANWHRFNRREQFDSPDPFFTTTERRGMMTGRCDYNRGYYANPGAQIRSGTRSFYVYVRVFGIAGQLTRVLIVEGAG